MYKEFSGRFEESMHFGEEDRVVFHVFEPVDLGEGGGVKWKIRTKQMMKSVLE